MSPDEKPTGNPDQVLATGQKERKTPWTKDQQVWFHGTVHQCKFCEQGGVHQNSGLTNHINNVHQERQNIFWCCKCGRKFNVFNMYIDHLGTHPKNEYKCHKSGKQFKDAHQLSVHSPTHLIQCPFCSRTFRDMKLLEGHVNNCPRPGTGRKGEKMLAL